MKRRITVFLFTLVFAFSWLACPVLANPNNTAGEAQTALRSDSDKDSLYDNNQLNYLEYLSKYPQTIPDQPLSVPIDLHTFQTKEDGFTVKKLDSGEEALITPSKGTVDFVVKIPQTGMFCVKMMYYPLPGSGSAAIRNLMVDGATPYYEASVIAFPRVWADADSELKQDNVGNDILPMQKETPRAETRYLCSNSGVSNGILYFYLTAGEHTISLKGVREPLALISMELQTKKQLPTFEEVQKTYLQNGYTIASKAVSLEAENVAAKSDATMYPLNDKTSPLTNPPSDYYVKYNTIGGSKWQQAGQWIEWEITVPEDGLYPISLRYKQNLKKNSTVYRRLWIDGNVPFAEADQIGFADTSGFVSKTLGDQNGIYYFYLTAGKKHSLRLEVVTGVYSSILEEAQLLVNELNDIYRSILMITGPSPDLYRDYNFPALIPEVLKEMTELVHRLDSLQDMIKNVTGWKNGSELSAIQRVKRSLEEMVADDTTIAGRFSNFQDNISALATWVLDTKNQPLEIDCILIGGSSKDMKGEGGFFTNSAFQFKQFIGSFIVDYNQLGQIGGNEKESVTVWIQTGRDQSQIIRGLINQDFTPNQGIGVKLQLVAAGSLLPAIIAGLGPDVALQLGQGEPINYAYRNAVQDLSSFSQIEEVKNRFSKQALVPFQYKQHLYALPESQSFQMLFYRKDILSELGITLQDISSWDSLFKIVLPELQKNYLSFGLAPTLGNYAMLLYQNSGQVYNQQGTETLLNSVESVNVFKRFTRLYTEYLQPVAFDFANRFRTGQMPLAVMDFTAYNQLSVFAPEIAGLWGMRSLPVTTREDGTVDQSGILNVSACVMFRYSIHQPAAWEFMKWWTSAGVQTQYGKNMESVMGTAARYNSANLESFTKVSWDEDIRAAIMEQSSNVYTIPEVPGGYYTSRYFDFAYRKVINDSKDVRSTLNDAVKQINAEIKNKREEFGLD